jgi:gamma-glutamylputrescine oxidase
LDHVNSFYAATLTDEVSFPQLNESLEVDVCVVGAGLAGLTTARELARAGKSVALIEANRVGWAASGRNGGFVLPGFALGQKSIAARVGYGQAQDLYDLSVAGADYVRRSIEELQLQDIIHGEGYLSLVRFGNGPEFQEQAETDPKAAYLDKDALREFLSTETYTAGLLEPEGFHIHPLRYARGLAQDASLKGASVFENSRVTNLVQQGGGWVCSTGTGRIISSDVVLTTSAYNGPLAKLERAVLPVATYVMASEPLGERLDEVIRFTGCLSDTRRAGDYYRVVGSGDDKRLLWGGRITTSKSEPLKLAEMLKRDILAIYPQLGDFNVDYAWSGLMGYARHKMPLIGQVKPGLWVGTAFGGHGLNTTAMAGLVISGAISTGQEDYRLFEPFQLSWGGGAVGRIATQLEYWRLKALDWKDERFQRT